MDLDGVWIPTEPECRRPQSVARDSAAGQGVATWEGAVREGMTGVLASDIVTRAGYPVATDETDQFFPVTVIRDGRTVARANVDSGDGLYFFFGASICPGTGIGAA